MTSRLAAVTAALAVVGAISAGSVPTLGPSSATAGTVDPAQFDRPRQNEYFPLEPGTIARFRGTDDGERYVERVRVTYRTRRIQGVATSVVRPRPRHRP